jgi:23S rRNA (adenine2030-N6)-methyltransferase
MNYRHIYHAGHYADVFKHWVLVLLLEKLHQKPAPFGVLDTHAGAGWYDLSSIEAQKTGEYRHGIAKLLALNREDVPTTFHSYLDLIYPASVANAPLQYYPGSPYLIQEFLRGQDQLTACELHPEQYALLKQHMPYGPQVSLHHQDGYLGMKAFLPLKQKRGLVLIDPPFEATDEFQQIMQALKLALQRFANGMYAIWYPIKHRPPIRAFHQAIQKLELPNVLVAELLVRGDYEANALNGCGMLLINPPWQLAETLQANLPWLTRLFATDKDAHAIIESL